MTVSSTVRQIVEILQQYTKFSLKDSDRLAAILQHAYDVERTSQLGDLAFSAKYLWKLYVTLEKQPADSEMLEKLETEFSTTIEEFRNRLMAFAAEGAFKSMVEHHYLSMQPSSLKHLLDLAHDLGWMKNWELDMAQQETQPPRSDKREA